MDTNISERSDWQPNGASAFDDYQRLRAKCPVAFSDAYGGFWSLLGHAEVVGATRDFETFPSGGSPFIEFPDFPRSIPISLNPPEHNQYRKLLNTYFRPERIAALAPRLQAFVDEHLDELLDGGRGDAMAIAQALPQRALVALLNMPDDAYLVLLNKLHQLRQVWDDAARANELHRTLWTDEVVALVDDRMAHPRDPDSDLMSGVLAATINGGPLPYEDCVAIGIQLFGAGGETTTSAITNALYLMATHPDIQDRLRREPQRIPLAVEEFLRLLPPLHHLARTTSCPVAVGSREIPAGARVTLNYAAANRDPDVFDDPDECVIDRSPNRHLTFGFGPHLCVGARLARLELQLVVQSVLHRTTHFELDGEPQELSKINLASGFSSLPLRFSTG